MTFESVENRLQRAKAKARKSARGCYSNDDDGLDQKRSSERVRKGSTLLELFLAVELTVVC